MNSIFDKIKGTPVKQQQPVPIAPEPPKKSVITLWKEDNSLLNTRKVIDLLTPTIDSALHTYAPGQLAQFKIKAINIALDSLKSFDLTKKVSPSTYVFTALQRLNRIRRERLNIIHIPLSQVYLKTMADKKRALMYNDLGRLATLDLLSDALGMSRKKLLKVYSGVTFNLSSAINPLSGDSTFKIHGVGDDDYFNYVYDSVSPIDKKIMLWSKDPAKGLSNNQIAAKLHLSPGAVSQRKAKIQQLMGLVRGLI